MSAQQHDGGGKRRRALALLLPWHTAVFLLKPAVGDQPQDRLLDRLGFWRATAGLALVTLASRDYLTTGQIIDNVRDKAVLTALYALGGALPAILLLIAVTRPARRRRLVSGTPRLLRRVGTGIACLYLPVGLFFSMGGYFSLVSSIGETDSVPRALLLLGGILFTILFGAWSTVFWTCTVYWGARTSLWLSELHPLFAPVGSVVLALVVTAQEILAWDTKGVPSPLWLGLNICGLVSTLVLAYFEYRHLRSSGYRFREGPDPLPAPSAKPASRALS